jgi:uncharacterized repeat protein (TIGR01451 family)
VETAADEVVHGHGHSGHPGDVIPPFDYVLANGETGHFSGLNWDAEGEAIFDAGCVRPTPPGGAIAVFGTCVAVHGSTYDATFGYSSGLASPVTIPIGSENHLSLSGLAETQVITFQPGTNYLAFTLHDIPVSSAITWTLTHGSDTSTATQNESAPSCIPVGPAQPIGIFAECVVNHGSTYDAVFGYESQNVADVTIPVSPANSFSPGQQGRGQPAVFLPGVVERAFTVTGIPASEDLTWTVVSTFTDQAVATAGLERKCDGAPIPPPPEHPTPEPQPPPAPQPPSPRPVGIFATCVTHHGSTYSATFGYLNENVHPVTVPTGRDNAVIPGQANRGQPETFHPTFINAAFTVRGVPISQAISWRVVFEGRVRVATATASLQSCVTAPIGPVADASVSKTANPRTVSVGQRVRFTIVVRNNGSAVIRPVMVTDTLPAVQLSLTTATTTLGRCRVSTSAGSHRVQCSAQTLAPGQSFTVRITARALSAGSASDHATVAVAADPTPDDNAANATVQIISRGPPSVTG